MIKSILFFTKGDRTVASSRQRVWFLADHLKTKYGYACEVLYGIRYPFFSTSRDRFGHIKEVAVKVFSSSYDIIFVHKSLFSWDVIFLIALAKVFTHKKLIYDLDDAQWVHSSARTLLFVRLSDSVFCGSHVIQQWVERHSTKARLVPTVLDFEIYAAHTVHHESRDIYTIGWTGTGMSHFRDGLFAMVKPALDRLNNNGVKFRFVVLGSQGYQPLKDYFKDASFETVFVDEVDWADAHAVPSLLEKYQFDVGIMPQDDTPFNRAKCAFKAIEYMACGVPAVASRVGENTTLIQDGVNGFLAGDTNEWEEKLRALLADVSLRNEMGERAQATIRERYSYTAVLPSIRSVLSR